MRISGNLYMALKNDETRELAADDGPYCLTIYHCIEKLQNRAFNPWWVVFIDCEKPKWGKKFKISDQVAMFYQDCNCNWQTVIEIREWSYL